MARVRGLRPAAAQRPPISPQLPHERDEVPDPKPAAPQPKIRKAASDIERGLIDTEGRQEALAVFNRAGKKQRPGRTRSRQRP